MTKKLGFVQFEVQFGDRAGNFARVEKLLQNAGDLDLIVLPELCFTGYDFKDRDELSGLAEPMENGPTSEFLAALATKRNSVVVAGYPEAVDDGKYYNSSMLVMPSGEFRNYRKIHLFSRENEIFSPGDAPPQVFDTPAGRIGIMICFDWFFPETARLLAVAGAQIIAHPSNLVLPYCQRAMYARSVENRVFSITCNRIGTEDRAGRSLTFTGGSQVLDTTGDTLAVAGSNEEKVMVVEADIAKADNKQINPYNNLIGSRRTDLYGDLKPEAKSN